VDRETKKAQIAELHGMFGNASGAYLTGFSGLTVEEVNELRGEFRKVDVSYRVVKNTLARKALEGTPLAELASMFEGPTAVALSDADPVAPAKVLKAFIKDHECLSCKGGYLDGELFGAEDLDRIAALPGRDDLRSMLLSLVVGVPRGIVTIFGEVPAGFVRVIEARRKELEEPEAETA